MKVQELLRQAQKAQQEIQEKLGQLTGEGVAGGGLVVVRLNGLKELLGIQLSPEALHQGDPELLAEMLQVAWQEAARQVETKSQTLVASLGLPGGLF